MNHVFGKSIDTPVEISGVPCRLHAYISIYLSDYRDGYDFRLDFSIRVGNSKEFLEGVSLEDISYIEDMTMNGWVSTGDVASFGYSKIAERIVDEIVNDREIKNKVTEFINKKELSQYVEDALDE